MATKKKAVKKDVKEIEVKDPVVVKAPKVKKPKIVFDIDRLANNDCIKLIANYRNRAHVDAEKHLEEYLQKYSKIV